ncbi:MAG: ABC transporter permease [Fimbriiglobus sp.]
MKRIAGVLILLLSLYACLYFINPRALNLSNLIEVSNRQGFFGILTISAAIIILSGGIDLSLGSVVGLGAVLFGVLLGKGYHPVAALVLTVLMGTFVGFVQGVLVHKLRLQAFLVTLCGMFILRGVGRLMTKNREVGLQEAIMKNPDPDFAATLTFLRKYLIGFDADETLAYPAMLGVFLVLAALIGLILHKSVHGRYWFALGYNEQAARYSGVNVGFYRVAAFTLGSTLAALGGCLLLLNYGTAKPDNVGVSYELLAITGAVLGGVSLRGGEGTIIGMALGAAVLPLLGNLVTFAGVPDDVIPIIVGLTLFLGSIIDEWLRRRAASRKG